MVLWSLGMIAMLVSLYGKFGHQISAGVIAYARDHSSRRWSDLVHLPDLLVHEGNLSAYRLTGLIVALYSRDLEREILRLGIPAVNVSSALRGWAIPSICIDQTRLGVLAAEYFLERGYRNLVYVPDRGERHAFITDRGLGFLTTARAAGGAVSWHGDWPDDAFGDAPHGRGALTQWLAALPKPVAVFASSDFIAAEVHAQVLAARLAVPEQVAILGVGNEHEAHFGDLGISSIETPYEAAGYRAAATLDAMLDHQVPAPATPLDISPRVITRLSTDARAVDDAEALQALRFIRENACRGIDVEAVVDQVPLSRRSLERRFRAAFGRTLKQDIQRIRIAQARMLLATTQLSIREVVAASGFNDRSQFFLAFRDATGLSPSDYRAHNQQPADNDSPASGHHA